jgi:hypothetical protein
MVLQDPLDRGEIRRLDGSHAEEIAIIGSCLADMKRSLAACLMIGKLPQLDVKEMLLTSAIIDYSRCFVSGVRASVELRSYKERLPDELAPIHDEVLHLRNKLIAHSVNAAEQYIGTYYMYGAASGKRGLHEVGGMNMRIALTASDLPRRMSVLTTEAVLILQEQFDARCAAVKDYLQTLDVDDLYAVPLLQIQPTSGGLKVDKSRNQR